MLKKADKTWVVHQIHEFLDDEFQINKIRTDLCSRMYCKHRSRRLDGENSHQSLASLFRNACLILYFERDTKIQKYTQQEIGLGATADPAGSKSIWRMCQSTRSPSIVISSECTNQGYKLISHNIFILMFCSSLV